MIFYLVTAAHRYTIDWFLDDWRPDLRPRVRVCSYDEALAGPLDSPGTYVFADVERLSGEQLDAADRLWLRLARRGDAVRLLNRPLGTWRRRELLRRLHGAGVNSFRARRLPPRGVYRLLDGRPGAALARAGDVRGARRAVSPLMRFPVFLRSESEHDGNLSPLVWGWRELRDAARELVRDGRDPDDLLIVEYCDTCDGGGVFRKYGAFVIGETVVPRGVMFSRHWMVKEPDLDDPDLLREQREYVDSNPHADWLRDLARRAGLGYGRVDYALKDGTPQVWEINTNPTIVMPRDSFAVPDPEQLAALVDSFTRALEAVDS